MVSNFIKPAGRTVAMRTPTVVVVGTVVVVLVVEEVVVGIDVVDGSVDVVVVVGGSIVIVVITVMPRASSLCGAAVTVTVRRPYSLMQNSCAGR